MFLVAFTLGIGTVKRPTATSLSVVFTKAKNRGVEDAAIGAVFVVCCGFGENQDGM